MSNEPLGIVEEAQQRRETYGRFAYRAPVVGGVAVNLSSKEAKKAAKEIDRIIQRGNKRRLEENKDIALIQPRIRALDVVKLAGQVTGVDVDALIGQRRSRSIAWPRHFAFALVRELRPDLSLPQIGKVFGRDHTSIMHGVRNVALMRSESPFRQWFADGRVKKARRTASGLPDSPFLNPVAKQLMSESLAQ